MWRPRKKIARFEEKVYCFCGTHTHTICSWNFISFSFLNTLSVHFKHIRGRTFYLSLNFQFCRHMGHCWFKCCEFNHLTIQCMWKQCEQAPQTNGQSSPGNEHSVQQFSNGIRQIPQFSSFATQRHVATAIQSEWKAVI